MTIDEICDLVLSVDPDTMHHFNMSKAPSYSYWEETEPLDLHSDDQTEEAWHFYVHYFTKIENDPRARTFFDTFDADPRVTVRWTNGGRESDTGYIHHIFDCEGC